MFAIFPNTSNSLIHLRIPSFCVAMNLSPKRAMRTLNKFNCMTIPFLTILKNGPSSILVTVLTYPMRWFGFLARFFQRIHKAPGPRGYQLITLLLFFPCFYLSDLLFKFAFTLNLRKLLRLSRQ